MSIEGKTASHFSEIGRKSCARWAKEEKLYCCSVATWPDYCYDFLEASIALPINKEIFGAFVAQLRKEKGLVRENVAEQGSLLDENWSPE